MPKPITTGGGTFDPDDRHIYFLATGLNRSADAGYTEETPHLLVAVNDITSDVHHATLDRWIGDGKIILLDSGIYTLAVEHARSHGISHDAALNLTPHQVDGFPDLLDRYVAIVRAYGHRLWGYIELDQGGRDNKITTRAHLESLGLRPIPVYHPFGDGWEYFDYLAERYDRICLGNIVQANSSVRLRLLATLTERKRNYPHLWVHALGLTPNEIVYAYPPDSADSSAWLSSVRWSGPSERACGATLGQMSRGFRYDETRALRDRGGHRHAFSMGAYSAALGMQNWRDFQAERDAMDIPHA